MDKLEINMELHFDNTLSSEDKEKIVEELNYLINDNFSSLSTTFSNVETIRIWNSQED